VFATGKGVGATIACDSLGVEAMAGAAGELRPTSAQPVSNTKEKTRNISLFFIENSFA
jgi:hypothetical protein